MMKLKQHIFGGLAALALSAAPHASAQQKEPEIINKDVQGLYDLVVYSSPVPAMSPNHIVSTRYRDKEITYEITASRLKGLQALEIKIYRGGVMVETFNDKHLDGFLEYNPIPIRNAIVRNGTTSQIVNQYGSLRNRTDYQEVFLDLVKELTRKMKEAKDKKVAPSPPRPEQIV